MKIIKINPMRNSLFILVLLLLGIGAKAAVGRESVTYLKTANEIYFGQDLKIGLLNSKIISSDGSVIKVPNRDVMSYMHNSRLFELLPVICEPGDTLCFAMMEYITTRSGLRLYRYNCYENSGIKCHYFIFKDGKYYLHIDQRNALTVLPFFGIHNIRISSD